MIPGIQEGGYKNNNKLLLLFLSLRNFGVRNSHTLLVSVVSTHSTVESRLSHATYKQSACLFLKILIISVKVIWINKLNFSFHKFLSFPTVHTMSKNELQEYCVKVHRCAPVYGTARTPEGADHTPVWKSTVTVPWGEFTGTGPRKVDAEQSAAGCAFAARGERQPSPSPMKRIIVR